MIRLTIAAINTGRSSAHILRSITGRPLWKPRIKAVSRNEAALSQYPQPTRPFSRLAKNIMKEPSERK